VAAGMRGVATGVGEGGGSASCAHDSNTLAKASSMARPTKHLRGR